MGSMVKMEGKEGRVRRGEGEDGGWKVGGSERVSDSRPTYLVGDLGDGGGGHVKG